MNTGPADSTMQIPECKSPDGKSPDDWKNPQLQ